MPTITGRAMPTYAWSMYDWNFDYKYSVAQFATLTFSGQTQTTAQATVTLVGSTAETTGSRVGIMYGPYTGGYDRKTRLVAGPSAAIVLSDLSPGTVYHCAAYAVDGLGTTKIGSDTLLTTSP